jgi:DNA primase
MIYIKFKLTKKQYEVLRRCIKETIATPVNWNNMNSIDDILNVAEEMERQRKKLKPSKPLTKLENKMAQEAADALDSTSRKYISYRRKKNT